MNSIEEKINEVIKKYRLELKEKIDKRLLEMKSDNNSHYFIYKVLGISEMEGTLVDEYQNKGRFLYKYAGSFLEEVTILCFEYAFKNTKRKVMVDNVIGYKPKKFEIDCLVNDKNAYEIKWRDATTDGDHITKEHTRAKNIKEKGYIPIRIMFYYPNREQAIRIQETLKTLYIGMGGEYYSGDEAWEYIKNTTKVDLYHILKNSIENTI
ncbi:MAG: ApaLI family restriction endonuclease [Clostridia bacterium]|nr:ApaLI family restriction endonuclease [Clostridia bacterium]